MLGKATFWLQDSSAESNADDNVVSKLANLSLTGDVWSRLGVRQHQTLGLRREGSEVLYLCTTYQKHSDSQEMSQGSLHCKIEPGQVAVELQTALASGATRCKATASDMCCNWEVFTLEKSSQGMPIASSVTLRVVDENGDTIVLPFDTSVREQLYHAVKTGGAVLCFGARISNLCGMVNDVVVLRNTPRSGFFTTGLVTSVTFDNEKTWTNSAPQLPKDVQHGDWKSRHGGSEAYQMLEELVLWPILFRAQFAQFPQLGSPRGILLHGPPGTGKTTAVQMLNERLSQRTMCRLISFGSFSGSSFQSVGAVEKRLRQVFSEATRFVQSKGEMSRCIVFIDELDGLFPKREGTGASENRAVAQLLTLMDGADNQDHRVILIGATNLPDAVDSALRRPGRFEKEIHFGPPSLEQRKTILRQEVLQLAESLNTPVHLTELDNTIDRFARACVGYVGADLVLAAREAVALSRRVGLPLSFEHFEASSRQVGTASLLRRWGIQSRSQQGHVGFKSIRVGGYAKVKKELERAVDWPVRHKDAMERMKISPPRGILMHGPPGCSKTTIARKTAQTTGYSFFILNAADVYSPYVGDAEKTVRDVFASARLALPAIVFLDEVEALVGKRGLSGGSGASSSVQSRVLSTLLNEMDGVSSSTGLLVLGATNRLDMIDEALLRPGRFDRLVHVPLPSLEDREEILSIHLDNMPVDDKSTLIHELAIASEGKSGAELENMCREAALVSLRRGQMRIPKQAFKCLN